MRAVVRSATAAEHAALAASTGETLVAEQAGELRGYLNYEQLGPLGHVRRFVAHEPDIGDALVSALHARGVVEWQLTANADDTDALARYEHLGLRAASRSTVLRVSSAAIARLPAELAMALPVAATGDDELERTFDLPAGRIAMARQLGHALVQLRDHTLAPVGFAAFDGTRVLPLRLARPALAPTLFAALRRRAPDLVVVVDDDPALAAALLGAGAVPTRAVVHYYETRASVRARPRVTQ
ncbi:MAG TPA: hypothetical protein VK427_11535 [Kofleriaceae bacterium]|nr:hypothetical protein [Kofleriaceae bacterium]